MFQYIPVEESLESPELGAYRSYGIRVVCTDDLNDSDVLFVSDVSADYEFVRSIAELCTAQQLHPIHLKDVISDMLQLC